MEFKAECEECKKRFQFEESLVVHQTVCLKHQETRSSCKFSCEQCGRSFRSMTSLRNHARTHTDYFDITKDIFERTVSFISMDTTNNILESTRSEADTSTINRSLDISAVLEPDSTVNVTYSLANGSRPANPTLIDDFQHHSDTFKVDQSSKPKIEFSDTEVGENVADKTFVNDIQQEDTGFNKTQILNKTIIKDKKTIKTSAFSKTDELDKLSDQTYIQDQTNTKGDKTFVSETLIAENTQINKTYVFDNQITDNYRDETDDIGLGKTYIFEEGRRKSADRTYILQKTCHQTGIWSTGLPTCGPTRRSTTDHVHIRRISIPVANDRRDTVRVVEPSPMNVISSCSQVKPGLSVKSIRTLRTSRSESRTPVKTNKQEGTPTADKDRCSRSTSKTSKIPNEKSRSKSRSRTPIKGRCSKYALRVTSYSGTDYMGADSPFRLTLLSPNVSSGSKKTPLGAKYKCKKCGKAFNDKDQFDIHYVIHLRDTPAKCGIPSECYKKNNRKLEFSTPDKKAVIAPKSTPLFTCPHCRRSYKTEKYLMSHMKIHFIDVPFACDQCDKRFKYARSLRAHAITHIGEEANKENDKKGANGTKCIENTSTDINEVINDLTRNKKLSMDFKEAIELRQMLDQPFTCNSCPYKTNQPGNLLKHMQTHSKARPFKCSECDKSYKTKSNLDLHSKVHMIGKIKNLLSNRKMSIGASVTKNVTDLKLQ